MSNDYVFISYSSKDIIVVKKIIELIQNENVKYWIAPDMIKIGSSYAKEIPNAIKGAKAFLLIFSENSQKSIWVEKELDCGINNSIPMIPVNISGYEMNDTFKFYLNNVQMINYFENEIKAFVAIKESLKNIGFELKIEEIKQKRTTAIEGLTPSQSFKVLNENPDYLRRSRQNTAKLFRNDKDDFRIVKAYLDKNGPDTIEAIHEKTGVPKESIKKFIRDERLEIPETEQPLLVCSRCKARIRTGYLCEKCKMEWLK